MKDSVVRASVKTRRAIQSDDVRRKALRIDRLKEDIRVVLERLPGVVRYRKTEDHAWL